LQAIEVDGRFNSSEAASRSISQGQIQTIPLPVENAPQATFLLAWSESASDLDLILVAPDGTRIDPNFAAANPDTVQFSTVPAGENLLLEKFYVLQHPMPGNWTLQVTGRTVSAPQIGFLATAIPEGGVVLAVGPLKGEYDPSEQALLSAQLTENGVFPVLDANVQAVVSRPDGATDTVTLFDDGLHGDGSADDSVYGNHYLMPSGLEGTYVLSFSASGNNAAGEPFSKGAQATARVVLPEPQQFVLTVNKAGTGNGTVTSNPVGVNCGTTCSASYDSDTPVTLTATPVTGSIFANWSGDPDCLDGSVTMDADKNCIATFNPSTPDLVETAVTDPPATAVLGNQFSVTDTAKNQGNGTAGASTTRYYLSLDTLKGGGDKLLTGTRAVPSLVAGAQSSGTVTVTVPAGTAANSYYLLACADDTKTVAEGNEGNNCKASVSKVTVSAPDLVETAVSNPPATAVVGSSFSVTDTAKNQGTANAGTSTTRYYLSLDMIKGGDKLLTGTRAVPSLVAGTESNGTVTVTIPSGTAVNSYFLLACADNTNVVWEGNEGNNCKASVNKVTVGP
jgi:hypothetical protein